MKKNPILLICLLLILFLAAACGSNSASVFVEMGEFKFNPDTFEVPVGAEVNLTLENTGTLDHELAIMFLDINATIPFDEDDEDYIYWVQKLEAGERITVVFTAPAEPGEYQIVCGIPAHMEQGMVGTMIVK